MYIIGMISYNYDNLNEGCPEILVITRFSAISKHVYILNY